MRPRTVARRRKPPRPVPGRGAYGASHGDARPDTPKSGHEREVPLSPRLAAALWVLQSGGKPDPGARVSLSSRGTEWGESSLLHAFRGVLRRAGLPRQRVHDLRHYFVTRCFAVGGDAPTVQALAGHQHLSVTQRYAHTSAEQKRQLVGRLGS